MQIRKPRSCNIEFVRIYHSMRGFDCHETYVRYLQAHKKNFSRLNVKLNKWLIKYSKVTPLFEPVA